MPAKPFPIRSATCSAVSASITGGPGIAIRTMAILLAGRADGQPAEVAHLGQGDVGAHLHAQLLVQKASASSWSWTQSCAVAILIIVPPWFGRSGRR